MAVRVLVALLLECRAHAERRPEALAERHAHLVEAEIHLARRRESRRAASELRHHLQCRIPARRADCEARDLELAEHLGSRAPAKRRRVERDWSFLAKCQA